MTTIAWDGRTLVADKRANLDGMRMTVTKIRRGRRGNLVGVSGTFAMAEEIFAWLCSGAERPVGQSDDKEWCPTIEITPQGEIYRHERWGRFLIEDKFYAVGSGSDFAMAAMALGKTAAEAVELAARFDTSTGDGLDQLPLKAATTRAPAAKTPKVAKPSTAARTRRDWIN